VAQKRRRKKQRWLRLVLLFIVTPLVIWCAVFLTWLYLDDIISLFTGKSNHPTPFPKTAQKSLPVEAPTKNKSGEKIQDEDRKKLNEIIKEREQRF